jgi:hypothetical protein
MDEKELQEIEKRAKVATPRNPLFFVAIPRLIEEVRMLQDLLNDAQNKLETEEKNRPNLFELENEITGLRALNLALSKENERYFSEVRRLQEELTALHASFAEANERKYNRLPQPPEMEGK